MMIKIFLKTVATFLLLFSYATLQAQENPTGQEAYDFDPDHTSILWFANHIGYSDSSGQFMDFDGDIMLDYDNPAQSSVKITIETASIRTGLDDFDAHLKSKDFFHVEQFPTMTFESRKVTLTGDRTAEIEGDLTLLGQTKPVALRARFNKRGMDIQKNFLRTGFSVRTTIKRSDWGMKAYLPLVGDEVDILIEAEGLIKGRDEGQQ